MRTQSKISFIAAIFAAAVNLQISNEYPAQAQIPVYDDIPEKCGNESRIFTLNAPSFSVDPTWVAPCNNFCDSRQIKKMVWYPTSVCNGSIISSVTCGPDENHPGCNELKIESAPAANASGTLGENFDCAANPGSGWRCSDRTVELNCAYKIEGQKEAKDFTRDVTHAYCIQDKTATTAANPNSGIGYWLMDWSDYGTVYQDKISTTLAQELRIADGRPAFDIAKMRRFYWEDIQYENGTASIRSGPKFYLYSATPKNWPRAEFNGGACKITPVAFSGSGYLNRVECPQGDIPNYYYGNSVDVPADKRHEIVPGLAADFLDQNFDLGRKVPYPSFAVQYWGGAGIAVPSTAESLSARSAECAAISEKMRFALGYFISGKDQLDFSGLIQEAEKALQEVSETGGGNHCRSGQELDCAGRSANCGPGWSRYWNGFAEFSIRNAIYAKFNFIQKSELADLWTALTPQIGSPEFKVPFYLEPHEVWGASNAGQMNKVGRIWQFIVNPVSLKQQ